MDGGGPGMPPPMGGANPMMAELKLVQDMKQALQEVLDAEFGNGVKTIKDANGFKRKYKAALKGKTVGQMKVELKIEFDSGELDAFYK